MVVDNFPFFRVERRGGVPSYGGIKAILISRLTARDVLHQRYYQLKFADTYYGEMTHYGLYRLAWADVRRTRG